MWLRLLLVACGGAIGSVARFALGTAVRRLLPGALLPWGTVTVNLLGCACAGLLAGACDWGAHAQSRAFVVIGILGGFTTFSSFGLETFDLLRRGHPAAALANVAVSAVCGVLAVAIGYAAGASLRGGE